MYNEYSQHNQKVFPVVKHFTLSYFTPDIRSPGPDGARLELAQGDEAAPASSSLPVRPLQHSTVQYSTVQYTATPPISSTR